jgi:hypothetical protein
MNVQLTKSIIRHIYSSLLITESYFINYSENESIINNTYIIDRTLDLNDSETIFKNTVWGCQSDVSGKKISLLVGDCSLDKDVFEYCLIVKLEDAPSYGCYLVVNEEYDPEALIACTLDGKNWMECNTYLQATFLAGMEQFKELNTKWVKIDNYDNEFNLLKSFLSFHNSIYGAE